MEVLLDIFENSNFILVISDIQLFLVTAGIDTQMVHEVDSQEQCG